MQEQEVLAALTALAQPTRLAVFRLLVKTGPSGLAAGAIAERVGARPNTLSTHLQALLLARMVTRERVGRSIIYRADYAQADRLIRFLMEDCCQDDREQPEPRLDTQAIADTAEGRPG